MKNKKMNKIISTVFAGMITFGFFSVLNFSETNAQLSSGNTTLVNLQDELQQIKNKIKNLESEREAYEGEVDTLRKQSLSLQREISLLDNHIAQLGVDIETEQARVDQTNLEIQGVDLEIAISKKNINDKKEQLRTLITRLDRMGETDYLNILLFNDSFSDFFDSVKNVEDLEGDVFMAVQNIHTEQKKLDQKKEILEEKKAHIEILKGGLEKKQLGLEDEEDRKNVLLVSTRSSERRFQQMILELKREREAANADILSLEREIRDKLARDLALQSLGGDESFLWPVDPSRGITSYFHDPSYPYRYIFEHPGLDVRASQGTPIKAMKSGYVARAKNAGLGYSYVVLIHDEDFSTVYGHVSQILVREDDFVVQGQTIALSGGAPGTPGAGNLSTGPHVHFEMRQSGIPVNPLNYL